MVQIFSEHLQSFRQKNFLTGSMNHKRPHHRDHPGFGTFGVYTGQRDLRYRTRELCNAFRLFRSGTCNRPNVARER